RLLIYWFRLDVFVMSLQGIDMIQHYFWHYMIRLQSQYEDDVLDWYVKMDEAIGRLTHGTDEDTFVLVLSDHGGASVASTLYINEFLRSQGLLECNNNGGDLARSNGSYRKIRQLGIK